MHLQIVKIKHFEKYRVTCTLNVLFDLYAEYSDVLNR